MKDLTLHELAVHGLSEWCDIRPLDLSPTDSCLGHFEIMFPFFEFFAPIEINFDDYRHNSCNFLERCYLFSAPYFSYY